MIKVGDLLRLFPADEPSVVAFSGGVDSTLVAFLAWKRNPAGTLAVTVASPLSAAREVERARELAKALGIPHLELELDELTDRRVAENHPLRCYYCKRLRCLALLEVANGRGAGVVMDGSNADDAIQDRPGRKAAAELGVRSPLEEAGLGKEDIRRLARELDLPNWDAPSKPCLATRFPVGHPLRLEEIRRVEAGEYLLEEAGFREFRLRSPEPGVALLEISREEMALLRQGKMVGPIVSGLKGMGFHAVLLDLDGYRSGSMERLEDRRLEVLG